MLTGKVAGQLREMSWSIALLPHDGALRIDAPVEQPYEP
jgi:hypothetical protein